MERLFVKLCQLLDSGEAGVDAGGSPTSWPGRPSRKTSCPASAVAVDGTDVETWGALHGEAVTVELDGEATETQLSDDRDPRPSEATHPSGQGAGRRSRWPEAATQPTPTPGPVTARPPTAGRPARMSATSSIWPSRPETLRWTNHVDRTTL